MQEYLEFKKKVILLCKIKVSNLQAIHFSTEDKVLSTTNTATEIAVPSFEKLTSLNIRFKLSEIIVKSENF